MIKFLKTRKVASPEREKGNAGFDFFVPEFTKEFMRDCALEAEKIPQAMCWFLEDDTGKLFISVDPHRRVSIPSGIKARIELDMPICSYNLGIDLVVENKSARVYEKDEISEEEFWKDFPWNNRGDGWAGSTDTKAK